MDKYRLTWAVLCIGLFCNYAQAVAQNKSIAGQPNAKVEGNSVTLPSGDICLDSSKIQPVITGNDTGKVNWTTQFIEAKGWAVMDTSTYKIPGQAALMARSGAIAVAQRNLLEITQGVRIVSEVTVKDFATKSDYIYKKLDAFIKGAQIVGEPVQQGNIIEVTMRVPLYQSNTSGGSLGAIMKEEAQKYLDNNTSKLAIGKEPTKTNNLNPTLFPVVVDNNGKILYNGAERYNPSKGAVPQYIQLGEEAWAAIKNKNPEKVLEVLNQTQGVFKVGQTTKFDKFLNVAGKVLKYGKFLIALI